jgi:hypothetical protein
MIPWLDTAQALALHRALLEDSLRLLKAAAPAVGAAPILSFSEPWEPGTGPQDSAIATAASGIALLPQTGGDLGDRLRGTFRELLGRGHRGVVIFGSDSPTLPLVSLAAACDRLRSGAALVLGPAGDGGYCLLGACRVPEEIFSGIPWGTSGVFETTLLRARRAGIEPTLLPAGYDVDRPADLGRLHEDIRAWSDPGPGGYTPRATAAFLEELARAGRLPATASPFPPGRRPAG